MMAFWGYGGVWGAQRRRIYIGLKLIKYVYAAIPSSYRQEVAMLSCWRHYFIIWM